jgi:hypothetical protein
MSEQSWLSRVGSIFGKVLRAITGAGVQIEKAAVPVAEALLPQFAPFIAAADGIFGNIVKECVAAEAVQAAAGTATGTGPQKLAAVLANIGPMLDTWVSSNFPGSSAISSATKAGLVNAVVAVINELEPPATVAPPVTQ